MAGPKGTSLKYYFNCKKCGRSYKYEHNMKYHQKRCGQKLFSCVHCQKEFTSKFSCKRHMIQAHNDNWEHGDTEWLEFDKIEYPPPSFNNLLLNPAHERCRRERNELKEREIKYPKALSEDYNRPGYSHDSQFACRHCGKRYRWKSTMRRHELVECGGKEPTYKCPQCPYRAKQKGNLGVHIRKHHTSEQMFCSNKGSDFLARALEASQINFNNNNSNASNNNNINTISPTG